MNRLHFLQAIGCVLAVNTLSSVFGNKAFASRSWVERAYDEVIVVARNEEAKAVASEQDAHFARERHDRRIQATMQKIAREKLRIEAAKERSESAQRELEAIEAHNLEYKDQLQAAREERQLLEKNLLEASKKLEIGRSESVELEKKLRAEITELGTTRKKLQRKITKQTAENEKARLETEHLRVQRLKLESENEGLDAAAAETQSELQTSVAQLVDAKKHRDEARSRARANQKILETVKNELDSNRKRMKKLAKEREVLLQEADTENSRHQRRMMRLSRDRIAAEGERLRLESEATWIKEFTSGLRKEYDRLSATKGETDDQVWKASIALESAQTTLDRTLAEMSEAHEKPSSVKPTRRTPASGDSDD